MDKKRYTQIENDNTELRKWKKEYFRLKIIGIGAACNYIIRV